MQKTKFEVQGYGVEQRLGEELTKGDKLTASEDLCYILLPKEYSNKNIICILTEEMNR